jgi:hypothetical protein
VLVSLDPEDSVEYLPDSIINFGGKKHHLNVIYFIDARMHTTTVDEERSLESYCVDIC